MLLLRVGLSCSSLLARAWMAVPCLRGARVWVASAA